MMRMKPEFQLLPPALFFFHSWHKQFCHFSCEQPSAKRWMCSVYCLLPYLNVLIDDTSALTMHCHKDSLQSCVHERYSWIGLNQYHLFILCRPVSVWRRLESEGAVQPFFYHTEVPLTTSEKYINCHFYKEPPLSSQHLYYCNIIYVDRQTLTGLGGYVLWVCLSTGLQKNYWQILIQLKGRV